jgi:hypothetical protein
MISSEEADFLRTISLVADFIEKKNAEKEMQ